MMAIFDLDARITEEDLSGTNRKTRHPIYLYIEAQTAAGAADLALALRQFLKNIMEDPTLKASADVEIGVFGMNGCAMLKECSAVEDETLPGFSNLQPTEGQSLSLAPVLAGALSRIAAQKRRYQQQSISYGKPSLLVFTSGNLTDEAWQLQDAVGRALRESSVDILPVCWNHEHPLLKAISSKGKVMQMPVAQAYSEVFGEIRSSMERLSKSTAATYQELSDSLVDGKRYFL